eukprot:m.87079 g.87079  ORF g.87079 m.87079 type:complete len:247 (+) comp50954_c0_seq1:225-965(+)
MAHSEGSTHDADENHHFKSKRKPDMLAKPPTTFIRLADNFEGYSLDMFAIPTHYQDDLETILIPNGLIRDRIEKLSHYIRNEFENEPLTVLCVLKGGHQFFADMIHYIKKWNTTSPKPIPLAIEFIRAKSYEGEESSGLVQIQGIDDLSDLKDRNVLIVEDIIDTGLTMQKILKTLEQFNPRCVKVASLFVKRTSRSSGYRPDYIGFEVPDKFIVGYALDYNEHFRDLQHVAILNDNAKHKYAEHK